MNCKYCGAGLPTNAGSCPNCGRMIPVDQLRQMKEMTDPRWNNYRNKDTGFYKTNQQDKPKISKGVIILAIIVIIILLLIIF